MVKVFVSHSSEDREFIEQEMLSVLHSAGIETWYAHDDIRISEQWERAILEALKSSDFFLLVMSPRSARSRWVRTELHFAMNRLRDRIVPVLIDDCDPVEFHLALPEIQHVDFRDRNAAAEEKLLQAFDLPEPDAAGATFPVRVAPSGEGVILQPPRSHFHCGPWVPPAYFIGRQNDLAVARHLIETGQSFLIVGHPRAGKTSFCRKLKDDIDQSPDANLLVGYLNLQQFSELSLTTFLEHTLLSIVGEMARRVFRVRYSDLRSRNPAKARPELVHDTNFQSFIDIFRLVRERTHESESNAEEESGSVIPDQTRMALDRHDFEQFCRDLLEIAESARHRAFVMFYDEANRIFLDESNRRVRKKISARLLESIAEALADSGLVGGYVASPAMVEEFRRLAIFGEELPLGPFDAFDDMRRLLARYYFNDVSRVTDLPVGDDALGAIWQVSRGEPFLIQLVADRTFRLALSENSPRLTARHVDEAHVALRKERPNAFDRL